MNAARHLGCLLVLAVFGCTTETSVPHIGTALAAPTAKLPLPSPSPLPGNKFPTPVLNLCPDAPDLSVQVQSTSSSTKDWLYVCTPIKNAGGAQWSSSAAQLGLNVSTSLGGTKSLSGFATLAPGSSFTRCGWVKANGLIRAGHDTAKFGECQATLTVTTALSFDPDILLDGNEANDDCKASNNTRTSTVKYMAACPW
jgi:hypothetical protein